MPFLFSLVCFAVCIRQHRNRPLRSNAFNAHGTTMPAPMGSVQAQIITKPSRRAGLAVSRSELVKPGAATWVFRGMAGLAGSCLKSLGHT